MSDYLRQVTRKLRNSWLPERQHVLRPATALRGYLHVKRLQYHYNDAITHNTITKSVIEVDNVWKGGQGVVIDTDLK